MHAWVKIIDAGKIDRHAHLGHFIGLDSMSTGYRIYFPDKKQIRVEHEVVFNREELTNPVVWTLAEGETHNSSQHPCITRENNTDDAPDPDHPDSPAPVDSDPLQDPDIEDPPADDDNDHPRCTHPQPGYYRSLAGHAPRKENVSIAIGAPDAERYDVPMFALHAGAIGSEPCTLSQALTSPDANQWRQAYQIELDQLKKLRTWDIISRPVNKPVIPCSYIFKIKLGPAGEVLKYKARVVAGGHRQKKGVNYDETFAAAAKIALIHVLLTLAAQCDWEIDQIDVVSAYLNADLEDEVYMEAPDGVLDEGESGKVCRLRKGLY